MASEPHPCGEILLHVAEMQRHDVVAGPDLVKAGHGALGASLRVAGGCGPNRQEHLELAAALRRGLAAGADLRPGGGPQRGKGSKPLDPLPATELNDPAGPGRTGDRRHDARAFYGTYVSSSRSGSLGVEKSLEIYKRTQS
jgi:hypothetical protein